MRKAGVPSTAASAVTLWLSPRQKSANARTSWMEPVGRGRQAQRLQPRRESPFAGDEEPQAARETVAQPQDQLLPDPANARVVVRPEGAEPDDGVTLARGQGQLVPDPRVGPEAVGVEVEELLVGGVREVPPPVVLVAQAVRGHDGGGERVGQPAEERDRAGVVVVDDHGARAHQPADARGMGARPHDEVRSKLPGHAEQPELPLRQLAHPAPQAVAHRRQHARRDAEAVEQRQGDVLVARDDVALVAAAGQLHDRMSQEVDLDRVVDVEKESHAADP
jgi:hypothetical protein